MTDTIEAVIEKRTQSRIDAVRPVFIREMGREPTPHEMVAITSSFARDEEATDGQQALNLVLLFKFAYDWGHDTGYDKAHSKFMKHLA